MTGFGPSSEIKTQDSASVDAFGRWRSSTPGTIFETEMAYDDQPNFWETVTVGAGSTLFLSDESALELTCGTSAGDRVIRQTYQYFRYQPGKSQLIIMTGVLGLPKTNVITELGYFDGYDGCFFIQAEDSLGVALRSSTSGTPIDTIVKQADWNIDKFDGNGPSGIVLDPSKIQIFLIDFQWLGAGRVRYGFESGGSLYYCHEMLHANKIDQVYMSTPHLPLRYEIENIGPTASATSMKQVCATIISEGGFEEDKGIDLSVGTGITAQSITARASVLAIRPKMLFNSVQHRGNIIPLNINVFAETNSVYYEVILKGSIAGAIWNSVNDDSITEYSTTSDVVTGGIVIASGYALAGGPPGQSVGGASSAVRIKFSLGSNYDGSAQDQLIVVATALSGTALVYASITFKERF